MIINRQYLLNNLWYGENSREANRFHHYSADLSKRFQITAQVLPDGSKIFGIDISHWNRPGTVDLQLMKALYNIRFVIIKMCDGSVNTNYYFEHVQACKDAGIPWGAYVWLYPSGKVNIDAQVNAWHARAIIDPPPLGIFIDAEWTYYGGVPANPNATDLRQAHDKIKVKQGKSAITYTAKGYADTYLKGFDWTREELWAANYGVDVPALPLGAPGYILHQFTSTFQFNGVNYDGNYFNGTEAEFIARGWGSSSPPPIGGTMLYGKVNTGVLNIRSTGAATGADIGDLVQNDYIVAFRSVNGWWEIDQAFRGGWNGAPVVLANGVAVNDYTGAMWCKDSYIVAVAAPPPPPPPARVVTDISIALAAGSGVTRKYSHGTTENGVA